MTQWRLFSNPGIDLEGGDDSFVSVFGELIDSTTEADVQCKFYTEYTCTDLRVEFSVFGGGSAVAVTLRDDGADTSVAVSVSGTGWTEDLTDSAAPAANSLMSVNVVNTASMHGDDILMDHVLLTIEHASINVPMMYGGRSGSAGVTVYAAIGSVFDISGTIAEKRIEFKRTTVLTNWRLLVLAAISAPDWDCAPAKNGTPSTSVTVNITGTGALEDTTGSEAYVKDDTASFHLIRTSGTITFDQVQIDSDTPEVWLNTAESFTVTTREYMPFSGRAESTTVNDNFLMRIGSVSAGHLETYVDTAGSGTRDVSIRLNSTNSTNLTINVTVTGYQEDLTGSDSVADDDSLQSTLSSSGTGLTVQWIGIECPWSDPPAGGAARRVMITSD